MNLHRFAVRIVFLWLSCHSVNAQEALSFGFSGSYNFPLETVGIGTRANIPLRPALAISPQIRYAPAFNDIHELSVGANLHFHFFRSGGKGRYETDSPRFAAYLIGGIHYNRWINYSPSANLLAKTNNVLPEAGLGLLFGGSTVKVFLEGKYNPLWQEPSAEAGLLISPFGGSRKKVKCFY